MKDERYVNVREKSVAAESGKHTLTVGKPGTSGKATGKCLHCETNKNK